ncbi:MAG: DUF5050 domain-containing protein [Bacteroidales bacterium]|nr:DUF5050 domain-containing protein [Bacteroidales bacterium]
MAYPDLDPDSAVFEVLFEFNQPENGGHPVQLIKKGNILYGLTIYGGSIAINGILYQIYTDGTGFKKFDLSFMNPHSLTMSDSILYGISNSDYVTDSYLFRVNAKGSGYKKLHTFGDTESSRYDIMAAEGTIYGIKYPRISGSSYLFKIKEDGQDFTTLGTVGEVPHGKLLLIDDFLYGTTTGPPGSSTDLGTVFKIKTDGTGFKKIHQFTNAETGDAPFAPLTLVGSTLYGTTTSGGIYNGGVLFRIKTDGTDFGILHHFSVQDGYDVRSKLVLSGNSLYGAAYKGGIYNGSFGTLFKCKLDGSEFQNIYNFIGKDGTNPVDLVVARDTIFGITDKGGSNDDGVIFRYLTNEKLADDIDRRIRVVMVPIMLPDTLSLETRNDVLIKSGQFIDLDTCFTVSGNAQYSHSWYIMNETGLSECSRISQVSENSMFYLFVTTRGCTYSDSLWVSVFTNDKEFELGKQGVSVTPNPNQGQFKVKIPSGPANFSYQIFNSIGILIAEGNTYCQDCQCVLEIHLQEVASGVYTIVIHRNGIFMDRQKTVISK